MSHLGIGGTVAGTRDGSKGYKLGYPGAIWQPSYHDRRVRDVEEYLAFREYIHMNPVRGKMVSTPAEYRYSSARPGFELDGLPQRLKPANQFAV
jgi:hypothetical protein